MHITCIKCGTITEAANVAIQTQQFGCPECFALISYENDSNGKVNTVFNRLHTTSAIKVGQKGLLNGIEYTVTGVVVKQVQKTYYWREYILTAVNDEQLYLSETDGHWILLKKVEDTYKVHGYPREHDYNGITLKLYDYDDPKTVFAAGFFDYNVIPKRQRMIEYINPPYIYSVEELEKEQMVYFGEHISSRAIKKAFNLEYMPYKSGTGIVQPFIVNVRHMAIVFCAFAILILFSHLFIYHGRESVTVLDETLAFSEYNGKDFVSRPFTLTGGSAPLTVSLLTNVDNSWATAQVGLINEKTNDEEYTSKDIEYYHGYEGGENWSEGSNNKDIEICGVNAGTYHLVITPQKPPEDITNQGMKITAVWNSPSSWNMIIPIVMLIVIAVTMLIINFNFERTRWTDSSYSPYE